SGNVPTRSFGIQYEDPCNVGSSEGCFEFTPWLERHIAYMKMTAQNRLIYPINWYHGPIIPVKCQPHERWNTVVMPDRRQYRRSTFQTPDWLEQLLTRFDAEGLRFTGSLTLMRLGNLMKGMNIDRDAVAAGADTWNMVLYDGSVQGTPNDWTSIYNPIIFPQIAESGVTGKPYELAYGECRTSDVTAPMFNPVHPEVRRQVREYIREIAEKYAHHPSFEGLCVNFWHGTFLWYGNLLAGYDDVSIRMFCDDTGITIPVAEDAPDRFAARYRWLMANAKEAFIDWRCREIYRFLCELRDILVSVRSDLRLTLNIWCEPSRQGFYPGREGLPGATESSTQYGIIDSHHEIFRMNGIDVDMFRNEPGISLCVERDFCRDMADRNGREHFRRCLTDARFLDEALYNRMRASETSEAFHFNCWVERWGRHINSLCTEADAENVAAIRQFGDYAPEFIHSENCLFDDMTTCDFFYGSQLRITAMFPPEPYFTELMGADLALHDALSITAGGLYLDKGHTENQVKFASEYRRLPAVKFNDLPGYLDPVCIRWLNLAGKTYVYALNREPYDIGLTFACGDARESLMLEPFELKVFMYDGEDVPAEAAITLPEAVVCSYRANAEKASVALEACAASEAEWAKGIPVVLAQLHEAASRGEYAKLRHLLVCYVVTAALDAVRE
ncbi:MAG: hypothetical protein J6C52_01285, partial [Clostridia bacterium]|nr:hypothetical protein [Clostridia bacterium]